MINGAQGLTSTTQDGALEPATYYGYSPEDVDQNGFLDNWGEKNLGYGFGINTNTIPLHSYLRIPNPGPVTGATQNCAQFNTGTNTFTMSANNDVGMANAVSGARHVLKLVDGGMNSASLKSYLPVMQVASGCVQNAANPTACGGFIPVLSAAIRISPMARKRRSSARCAISGKVMRRLPPIDVTDIRWS